MIKIKWICKICLHKKENGEKLKHQYQFRTIWGIAKHIYKYHLDLWKMVVRLRGYDGRR